MGTWNWWAKKRRCGTYTDKHLHRQAVCVCVCVCVRACACISVYVCTSGVYYTVFSQVSTHGHLKLMGQKTEVWHLHRQAIWTHVYVNRRIIKKVGWARMGAYTREYGTSASTHAACSMQIYNVTHTGLCTHLQEPGACLKTDALCNSIHLLHQAGLVDTEPQ